MICTLEPPPGNASRHLWQMSSNALTLSTVAGPNQGVMATFLHPYVTYTPRCRAVRNELYGLAVDNWQGRTRVVSVHAGSNCNRVHNELKFGLKYEANVRFRPTRWNNALPEKRRLLR